MRTWRPTSPRSSQELQPSKLRAEAGPAMPRRHHDAATQDRHSLTMSKLTTERPHPSGARGVHKNERPERPVQANAQASLCSASNRPLTLEFGHPRRLVPRLYAVAGLSKRAGSRDSALCTPAPLRPVLHPTLCSVVPNRGVGNTSRARKKASWNGRCGTRKGVLPHASKTRAPKRRRAKRGRMLRNG